MTWELLIDCSVLDDKRLRRGAGDRGPAGGQWALLLAGPWRAAAGALRLAWPPASLPVLARGFGASSPAGPSSSHGHLQTTGLGARDDEVRQGPRITGG